MAEGHTLWQTCLIQQLVLCLRSVVIRSLIEQTGRAGEEEMWFDLQLWEKVTGASASHMQILHHL